MLTLELGWPDTLDGLTAKVANFLGKNASAPASEFIAIVLNEAGRQGESPRTAHHVPAEFFGKGDRAADFVARQILEDVAEHHSARAIKLAIVTLNFLPKARS